MVPWIVIIKSLPQNSASCEDSLVGRQTASGKPRAVINPLASHPSLPPAAHFKKEPRLVGISAALPLKRRRGFCCPVSVHLPDCSEEVCLNFCQVYLPASWGKQSEAVLCPEAVGSNLFHTPHYQHATIKDRGQEDGFFSLAR